MGFLAHRPKDQPFCLTLAFFAAHAEDKNPKQYLPQPESMALYHDVTAPKRPPDNVARLSYNAYTMFHSRNGLTFDGGSHGHVSGTSPDYVQLSFDFSYIRPTMRFW